MYSVSSVELKKTKVYRGTPNDDKNVTLGFGIWDLAFGLWETINFQLSIINYQLSRFDEHSQSVFRDSNSGISGLPVRLDPNPKFPTPKPAGSLNIYSVSWIIWLIA